MANTSLHLPVSLLEKLDRLASERRTSRNRLIVEACQRAVEEQSSWPDGLFANDHLTKAELEELRRTEHAFLDAIASGRKSRDVAPF